MKPTRKINRRSFLGTVAGGVAGAGALMAVSSEAFAMQGCTDSDPTDASGRGRRCRSGCSDSDSGPNSDPVGNGRSCRRTSGCSDSDSGPNSDPGGNGRSCRRSCSDSDSGPNSDPVGRGRSC